MKIDKPKEVYYRYIDRQYAAPVDEFDNVCGVGDVAILCQEYEVLKHTDKSILVRDQSTISGKRWMRREATRVFASPTKKEALYHFIKRKDKQISIYKSRFVAATRARDMAIKEWENNKLNEENNNG
jgi:hypothetical protein